MHTINDECIACGTCAEVCPVQAIAEEGDTYKINDSCTDCGTCVESCPVDAIKAGA